MNTSTFIVDGTWRRVSSSPDSDLEAQRVTGTHAPFSLPTAPEPVRAAPTPTPRGITADVVDDFLDVTRQSPNDTFPYLPPPPYADASLPAYAAEPNAEEPATLARSTPGPILGSFS